MEWTHTHAGHVTSRSSTAGSQGRSRHPPQQSNQQPHHHETRIQLSTKVLGQPTNPDGRPTSWRVWKLLLLTYSGAVDTTNSAKIVMQLPRYEFCGDPRSALEKLDVKCRLYTQVRAAPRSVEGHASTTEHRRGIPSIAHLVSPCTLLPLTMSTTSSSLDMCLQTVRSPILAPLAVEKGRATQEARTRVTSTTKARRRKEEARPRSASRGKPRNKNIVPFC